MTLQTTPGESGRPIEADLIKPDEADVSTEDREPVTKPVAKPAEPAESTGLVTGPAEPAGSGPVAAEATTGRRVPGWLGNSGTIALLSWLVGTPVAVGIPKVIDRNPFSAGASTIPLAAAFLLIIGVFLLARRWSGEVAAGLAAGLGAAWTVLMLRSALNGTPFGFAGLVGDMGRMSAAATRYTTTIASSDTLVHGLPSEYPPFYAWLIGRASVLLDEPAWRLLADAEVIFSSAAVLAAFLLWRRLVGPWVALAISALTLATWSDPRKAFEVLTLAIFVPWALEVFARPTRRRMHWLPAGLLGGFIVITYQAWMVYAAIGLIALIVIAWRTEPDRWAYLRRLGLIVLVSFVVASWYIVPFGWASLTEGGQSISDLYVSSSLNAGLFPFLDVNPLGLLQLVGLVGLVWLWRSVWWARPLMLLVISAYGYRLISMVRYVLTQHTGFMHYTARLYGVLLTIAGVLVLAHLVPMVLRRLRLTPPRLAGAALLAVILAWTATGFTNAWMPETGSKYAISAHTEPLPGGGYPTYAPKEGRRSGFPITQVEQAVEEVLGPDAQPVTLSTDDRVFSFLPWPGFMDNDRTAGSTLSRWDDRLAEVKELAATRDPAAFAAKAANLGEFGGIQVFVLSEQPDGWAWRSQRFTPDQFSSQYWTVIDLDNVVVAVRR
ncbi:arabinofuranosyltransferase-like protein [Micromonospora pisi]|uniref:Arabinofuranosyltransferase-like protein n=1 Tax=Micromonospora pisi TaxID=589240 RepID=A0A495JLL6_9ACTN|nr:arabinofuranosyltransferase [Micromonospora pisi]RKR89867.1 arabinofuranosyltransferase-like protein [Micromonospora pisi]